jgi:signal transduction histidine kinase
LAVIVVAMALSGFLLLSLLDRYFLQAMEDSLVAQARITAQALIPGARAEGPPSEAPASVYNTIQQQRLGDISLRADNVASPPAEVPLGDLDLGYLANASLRLSSELDTRIRVLDTQGLVLMDSWLDSQGESLKTDELVSQALAGRYATSTEEETNSRAMHVAMPVLVEDQLVGIVFLSQTLGDAAQILNDLRTRWLISTVVALAFSAIVGLLLSGAISKPVRRLTVAAGSVARGNLDQEVPVDSRDELGRLSITFNEMTARLRASRQIQVDFVANVSHELRTPLTAVKGTVETLRDGAVDDPKVRDRFLETVEDETDRLIRLVNDLLTLSRADSEALSLQREPVDLVPLIQSSLRRLAPQAEQSGLVLDFQSESDSCLVLADADRIEQVLVNLLDNAIKYSHHGGTVSVWVEHAPSSMVRVLVDDQGIGIPAGELARIGERFYRADKARSRAQGGSGLGLAIAQALVRAHGGRLWLESSEGQGTQATFTLPSA